MKSFITGNGPLSDLPCQDMNGPQEIGPHHSSYQLDFKHDTRSTMLKLTNDFHVLWLELMAVDARSL